MTAKKRAATRRKAPARKALPANWNLEQLDEELRVALALAKRPGVSRYGDTPQITTPRRERAIGRGAKRRVEFEDVPWTQAQLDTIFATMAAHVADPLWGEKQDAKFIRLILSDADFDAYLAAPAATVPPPIVVRKLIRSVRALARITRGESV